MSFEKKHFKIILICMLFWWAIIFPQYSFLPDKSNSAQEIDVHFCVYDYLSNGFGGLEK